MQFNSTRISTVLLSGALALTLVGAQGATATPAAGTAASSLNAVTLTLTGVQGAQTLSLLDIATIATTDADAVGNVVGSNFASAFVGPFRLGDEAFGAKTIRSDEDESGQTSSVDLTGLGLPVDVVMLPVDLAATASEDGARAVIGAATASVSALTDLLDLDVSTAGIESIVTGESASQTQGLTVRGLDVKLGDIVPAELLAALPIDVLIDLLNSLPVGAPDVQAVVDAALALIADVDAGVASVVGTISGIESGLVAVTTAIANLADQQAVVDGLVIDEAAAQAAVTNAAANVEAAITAATDVELSDDGLLCVIDNLGDDVAIAACLDALQADLDAVVLAAQAAASAATATADQLAGDLAAATSLLEPLAAVVNTLTNLVDDLVVALVSLINDLSDDLTGLLAALTDLSNSLGDVLAGLLDVTLVGLGSVDLSMNVVSTGVADSSTTSVNCALGDLVVAGVNLGGGDCNGGALTGSLLGAVSSLESALGALPVVGDLAPDVSIDLMQMNSSIIEVDGVVTSAASVIPLVIDLPSIDIDPAGLLDGILGQLSTDLIDDLLASLPLPAELQGIGLNSAAAAVEDLIGQQLPGLSDVEALIAEVLAQLPDGLGIPTVTTPGFNLSIDPTSTASFTPGAEVQMDPLPATGGGALALAVIGLGGAWTLRRRR